MPYAWTAVRFNDYSYAYPETADYVLRDINLEISTGECHCVSGPTGSGKTTLALALKGLLPPGREAGEITFPLNAHQQKARIGLVLQNPEVQVLRSTIGAEAAFGLENLCTEPELMHGFIEEALSALGLTNPLSFRTGSFSMGQKYRLIVASHLVMNPGLLILDEPAGQLDPEGLNRLLQVIRKLKQEGISILLFENRPEPLQEVIDLSWHLENDGSLLPGPMPMHTGDPMENKPPEPPYSKEIISALDLWAPSYSRTSVWSAVNFSLLRGRRILFEGLNGSGKTTLLRCLLGFLKPSRGDVRVYGEKPVPWKLQGTVGCLFQNPQRQIFEASVMEEVAFPLKRLGQSGGDLCGRVRETLDMCSIGALAELSPHKLSYGQKRLVSLACALAHEPEILLLDDPLAGLDRIKSRIVLDLLASFNEQRGTTIILTSHDPGSLRQWSHVSYSAGGGTIAIQ